MLNRPSDFGSVDPISCRGMKEDSQGNIYIFTYSGFFVLPRGSREFIALNLKTPSDFDLDNSGIYSIEMLDDNTLIAYGAKNYFYSIDLKQKILERKYLTSKSLQMGQDFMDVKRINDSIVWAVSSVGIKQINYKTWESKDLKHPLQEFAQLTDQTGFLLLPSRDGQKIWLGMFANGLYEWDRRTNQVIHYSELYPENKLVGDQVRALHEDQKGNLWVGTTTGLQRISFPSRTSKFFTSQNGLFNAHITGILEAENSIWVGTYYGLAQVNLKAYLIEDYFESDGLTHNEFNVKSAFKSIDNQMYFGGLNGLVRFDPKDFTDFRPAPELYLLSYEKFDSNKGSNVTFNAYDKQDSQFELSSNRNYITLIFALNDIFNYHLNSFQYRIPSLNDNWNNVGELGRVELLGLSPGTYELQVRGFNSHGKVSNTLSYYIRVNQILIKRPWFVVMSLCVVAAFFLWFQYNRLVSTNSRVSLENKVMRLESRALAAQMNHHFIFNTLNHIQSAVLLKGEEEANKLFGAFSELLRITLENNKNDHIVLAQEIDYLKSYIYLEQARLDEKIEVNWQIASSLNVKELRIPPMLLQPIVENAIQHGLIPLNGRKELIIMMSQSDNTLRVVIQDNGVGREGSKNQSKNHKYKSWATTIMNERISLSNLTSKKPIEMSITDLYNFGKPSGTKVTLIIPILKKP